MLDKLVRFERPERSLPYAWAMDDAARAAVFGADPADYAAAVHALDAQRADAVRRLAALPSVRAALDRAPFSSGRRIMAIGESTTADRLSWFELLTELFATERPGPGVQFENVAISGSTTTQALANLPALRRRQPDVVFCMLGANDARRFPGSGGDRLVSAEETARNLRLLRRDAVGAPGARWIWVAPTPIDERRVAAHPYLGGAGLAWTDADMRGTAAILREAAEPGDLVIDPADASGPMPLLDDGLHPHLDAQATLAAHVLEVLAGPAR
ncbi:acyl-CoA thioesterase-1 [Agromyces cerinus subsp. cerinus]|uniref:Acyl-CoA thioesterase-1 n=2 Tax=Agromyces cerinus TaxID=33878 RepID=A0A1N6GBV0_9MICO|nr:acyl-CoA thioesterase-1 [Agromyces cerinus subsp. cerinus]